MISRSLILTLLCDFVFIIIHRKINSKRFTVILQFSHVFYENGSNGAERTPKNGKVLLSPVQSVILESMIVEKIALRD